MCRRSIEERAGAGDVWAAILLAVQAVIDWIGETLGSVWQAAADAVVAEGGEGGCRARGRWPL